MSSGALQPFCVADADVLHGARRIGEIESVGPEVGAARGVVEQGDAPHDDLGPVGVVVDVGDVVSAARQRATETLAGRSPTLAVVAAQVDAEGSDDPDDPPVVAHDRVAVGRMTSTRDRRTRRDAVVVVPADVLAGAAEQEIRTVRAIHVADEAEEVGAAADDVVLAPAPEDDVVPASTLDVVVAVGQPILVRGDHGQRSPTRSHVPAAVAASVPSPLAAQPSGLREAPT